MTRINLVDPSELCDQHLLAEHRELTRIPNVVYRRHIVGGKRFPPIPADYTVRLNNVPEWGRGHVLFFYNKMAWLFNRYQDLMEECMLRNFNVQNLWSNEVESALRRADFLWKDWRPDEQDKMLNSSRIKERLPEKARWTEPGRRPTWL